MPKTARTARRFAALAVLTAALFTSAGHVATASATAGATAAVAVKTAGGVHTYGVPCVSCTGD